MGMNGSPFGSGYGDVLAATRDLERAEENAATAARIRQQAADAAAMRELAERDCPEDVREFGRRHGIETFAEFTWQHGYLAGWKAAINSERRRPTPPGDA